MRNALSRNLYSVAGRAGYAIRLGRLRKRVGAVRLGLLLKRVSDALKEQGLIRLQNLMQCLAFNLERLCELAAPPLELSPV